MVPKTRRECPAESAGAVAVSWDQLLDALLKTLHLTRIDEEVVALLRRLPPLLTDLSADDIGVMSVGLLPVTRTQALKEVRQWRRTPGGAFAMMRYILNPHILHDTDFMPRNTHVVALGQDDGAQVLSFTPHTRDLFVEPRNTSWRYDHMMFLVLKGKKG